jgi:DNA-binding PadR family transcriptional regulator
MPRGMARARKGDLSGRAAVLGLLIKQSDTINGLKPRLERKFPGAWGPTTVYSAVDHLAKDGHVRIVTEGVERSLDRYEATPEGVDWFRRWVSEFSVPVLRDAVRAKLEYVSDEHELRMLLDAIREQEEACFAASNAAQYRLSRARERGELGSAKGEEWEMRLRYVLMGDEVSWWREWGVRLKRVREGLEGSGEWQEGFYDGSVGDG